VCAQIADLFAAGEALFPSAVKIVFINADTIGLASIIAIYLGKPGNAQRAENSK
jgi:hypothetical protein